MADRTKTPDITLTNSIVAGNSGATGPDILGSITTDGYNLVQRLAGTSVNDPLHKHATDITGTQLSTLGIAAQLSSNGGSTPTLALLPGSPAANIIPASSCDTSTDQRGVTRPQHGACDSGAYEYN